MNKYQVKAKPELVNEMIKPIISSLEENSASFKCIYQTNLALEEILVNIANYAYTSKEGDVKILYEIKDKNLSVTIKDNGKEFNPLQYDEPDLKASSKDRKIGGLGIYLVKNLVDYINYQRINDENILEIHKKLN